MASNSYDEVPYQSVPYAATHPDRLAVTATLFGLKPARADHCRVLELGCASGGNLIPLAVALPESRFVGIDSSSRQVAEGQKVIAALGLENIDIRAANILQVDKSLGTFDFIICHGVYSWVPEKVQDKILDICLHNLKLNGVAYVSYNTLPGWHMQGMIRDMMCYHVSRSEGLAPGSQVGNARSLLNFLAESAPGDKNPYNLLLERTLSRLQTLSDSYLFHEYLEDCNEAIYFHEFCRRLEAKKLRYLGEAHVSDMGPFRFPTKVRQVLNSLATDQVQMEQYLDFLMNRSFRRTLVCHAFHQPTYALRPEHLEGLHVVSCLKPRTETLNLSGKENEVFVGPNETTLVTDEPILKAALVCLSRVWPQSIYIPDLLNQALALLGKTQDRGRETGEIQSLGTALLRVITYSHWMVELWQCPPRFVTTASERPVASPLARWQALHQANVTNLRHINLAFGDIERSLLALLDGTRGHKELLECLFEEISSKLPGTTTERMSEVFKERLARFARGALLIA